jgi:aminocarboxymuconate-semialdehyde decarboxylase
VARPAACAYVAVDVHGHFVPVAFLRELIRFRPDGVECAVRPEGYVVSFPDQRPLRPIAGVMCDSDDRRQWLAAQRLAHQVVAPWLDLQGQPLPAAPGARWSRLLNDAMAEAVSGVGLLSAHASLHLADAESAAGELRRAVSELGMRSAMIPASGLAHALREPVYDSLWAAAVELDVPLFLHPSTVSPANEFLRAYPSLNGLFGRHIDTTLVAAELIVGGVFDRFPGLALVLPHGGGFLPYQAVRLDRDTRDARGTGRLPSDIVRALNYDTTLMSAPAVRFLCEYAGHERVMLGSDYGATPADRGGAQVTGAVLGCGLAPDARHAVLAANARRLFGCQSKLAESSLSMSRISSRLPE